MLFRSLVRVPSIPDEYYAIQTGDGAFKVFSMDGTELALGHARLSQASASTESGSTGSQPWTVGVIDLWFKASPHPEAPESPRP